MDTGSHLFALDYKGETNWRCFSRVSKHPPIRKVLYAEQGVGGDFEKHLQNVTRWKELERDYGHGRFEGAAFVDASNVIITVLRKIGVNTANKMLSSLRADFSHFPCEGHEQLVECENKVLFCTNMPFCALHAS